MLAWLQKCPARIALGVFLAATISACGGSSQEGRTKVQFTLGSSSTQSSLRLASALTYQPAAVLVTLEDASGEVVHQLLQLAVHSFGSSYVSESLDLPVGGYRLTQFLVVDASGTTRYAAPVEGADPAILARVSQPLPIPFAVSAGIVHSQAVEVLPVEGSEPKQFGYVAFTFRINQWAKSAQRVTYGFGEDGMPLTEDDVGGFYHLVSFDTNGDTSRDSWYGADGAGADQIRFTQDDVPLGWWWSRAAELRGSSHVGPGRDGIWVSDDDPITGWEWFDYTYVGSTFYNGLFSAAGPDGLWYTGDDVWSGYYTRELDATGAEVKRVRWNLGADGAPFTADDEVGQDWFGAYVVNTYDGKNTKWDAWDRQVSYVDAGLDQQWFTADDVVSTCRMHEFADTTQYWTRELQSIPGEDGACFTGDDLLVGYSLADNTY
jgi:hypothetical protein